MQMKVHEIKLLLKGVKRISRLRKKELVNTKPRIYIHQIFLESLLDIVPLNIRRYIFFQLNMVY